jgi:hypothetical protein
MQAATVPGTVLRGRRSCYRRREEGDPTGDHIGRTLSGGGAAAGLPSRLADRPRAGPLTGNTSGRSQIARRVRWCRPALLGGPRFGRPSLPLELSLVIREALDRENNQIARRWHRVAAEWRDDGVI